MVVLTTKVSRGKLAMVVCIALILLVLVLVISARSAEGQTVGTDPAILTAGATNDDRIACLEALGWEVSAEALTSQEVRIPEEWNEVFERYNTIQQSQGFDLTPYAGKTVKRYVYAVNNYPGADGQVVATLLVYKDRIIGGDITSTQADGFLHGLAMPEDGSSATGG